MFNIKKGRLTGFSRPEFNSEYGFYVTDLIVFDEKDEAIFYDPNIMLCKYAIDANTVLNNMIAKYEVVIGKNNMSMKNSKYPYLRKNIKLMYFSDIPIALASNDEEYFIDLDNFDNICEGKEKFINNYKKNKISEINKKIAKLDEEKKSLLEQIKKLNS